jgi:hypothetical protein
MVVYEDDEAIDAIIANLERIPSNIETKMVVNDIAEALYDKLRKKITV